MIARASSESNQTHRSVLAGRESLAYQPKAKSIPRAEKRPWQRMARPLALVMHAMAFRCSFGSLAIGGAPGILLCHLDLEPVFLKHKLEGFGIPLAATKYVVRLPPVGVLPPDGKFSDGLFGRHG